jgi:hypothetical protein
MFFGTHLSFLDLCWTLSDVFDVSLVRLLLGNRGGGEVGGELPAVPDSSELVLVLLAELSVLSVRWMSLCF